MFVKHGLYFEIAPEFLEFSSWLCTMREHFPRNTNVLHALRNTIKNFDIGSYCFTAKAFQLPHIINSFVYGFIRSSKAKRSYENANLLISRGINTPKPVAWLEYYEYGMLKESYYISLYERFDITLHGYALYAQEEQEKLIQEFVRYTVNVLHKNNICHLDFSPGNILVSRDEHKNFKFSIIDLNRMKERPMNFWAGLDNFSRQSEEHLSSIAKEYARIYEKHSAKEQEEIFKQLVKFYKNKKFLPACRAFARGMLRKVIG